VQPRWPDIDGDVIRIRRSVYRAGKERGEKGTQGGRERQIMIEAPGVEHPRRWRIRCQDRAAEVCVQLAADGFVVSPFPDGSRPVNPDSFSSAVHRLCVDLEMPHVHLHSLRHFAATEMLSAGIDARNAAEVLGHANPSLTLSVYAHATADRQRHADDVLGCMLTAETTHDALVAAGPPIDAAVIDQSSTSTSPAHPPKRSNRVRLPGGSS
jgi:integrase